MNWDDITPVVAGNQRLIVNGIPTTCVTCGGSFTGNPNGLSKYCEACRKQRHIKSAKDFRHRYPAVKPLADPRYSRATEPEEDWSDIALSDITAVASKRLITWQLTCRECGQQFGGRPGAKFCLLHSDNHSARRSRTASYPFRYFGVRTHGGVNYAVLDREILTGWESWHDILSWFWKQAESDAIYFTWHSKPAWARIFRTLPPETAFDLLVMSQGRRGTSGNPEPFSTTATAPDGSRWLIRHAYGGKLLKFKPKLCDCWQSDCGCDSYRSVKWVHVSDVGEYFSKSVADFTTDDATLGTPEQRSALNGDMQNMLAAESAIAAEAMNRVRTVLRMLSIDMPRKDEWWGIGKAGQKVMDTLGLHSNRSGDPPPHPAALLQAASSSYIGPFFENIAAGPMPGVSHEYDMNSAFGWILYDASTLDHGWHHYTGTPAADDNRLRLEYVHLEGVPSRPLGAGMHRNNDGSVCCPLYPADNWRWSFETDQWQAAGLISKREITEYWAQQPCDCPKPFRSIADIYQLRGQYPKHSVENNLLKMLPSTVYGKLAESSISTKYGNRVWASYVTAKMRAELIRAITSEPDGLDNLLMIISDSFLTRIEYKNLPVGTGLGKWKHKKLHNAEAWSDPGLWWSDESFKSSGIEAAAMPGFIRQAKTGFRSWKRTSGIHGVSPPAPITITSPERVITLEESVQHRGIPGSNPHHDWCRRCPICAGGSGGEVYRSQAATYGQCEMCGQDRRLFTDHCHLHNRVRGKLCNDCNVQQGAAELMTSWHTAGTLVSDYQITRTFYPAKRNVEGRGVHWDGEHRFFRTYPLKMGNGTGSEIGDMGWSQTGPLEETIKSQVTPR